MYTDQTEEASTHHSSEQRCNSGDPFDSMDAYWEKLRVDGQFSRWQKPATD